jgi:hypothetical protein
MKYKSKTEFPKLESVTKPTLTTDEIAFYTNLSPKTWRFKACKEKYPDDLRPLRICGRLAWPTNAVKRLLGLST